MKEGHALAIGKIQQVTLPFPSTWDLHAGVGRRPMRSAKLVINSVMNNRVNGTVNFRGTPLPIEGVWDEAAKQIQFETPFATYVGQLSSFDEPTINMRHYMMRGSLRMKPPSTWAGETGSWAATTSFRMR